jgi:hypothetical protein
MSITDPCRRCGHRSAWLLRPVREHDGVMPVEARVPALVGPVQLVGWYEAIVCAGCGWAQFWAHDYEPIAAAATIPACLECAGASGWTIAEASDILNANSTMRIPIELAARKRNARYGTVGWMGVLAVRICAQCAAAGWFCRPDVAYAADLDAPPRSPRPCRRCQSPQILSQLADWSGGAADVRDLARQRAIAAGHGAGLFYLLGKHMGRFELDVCLSCFSVDWHGLELATMRESPRLGVSRIERGSGEGDSGPYR